MGKHDFEGNARFEIVRRLGEGGMGVVYEARDRMSGGRLALKTLRGLDPDQLLGLKNEFRALQDIEHPNLVSFGQLIEDAGQWFFTMELVEGRHFLDYVRPRSSVGHDVPTSQLPRVLDDGVPAMPSVSPRQANARGKIIELRPRVESCHSGRLRSCLAELGNALGALHDAGVAHRDVKDSNILVTDAGRVVLLDFGLAGNDQNATTHSSPMGTLMYAAPERILYGGRGGPAADMYGVGVLLYEALTGREPFAGDAAEIARRKQHVDPDRPSALARDVPADLEDLCMRLMSREPASRPRAAELASVARTGQATDSGSHAAPNLGPSSVFVGRHNELAELMAQFGRVRVGVPRVAVVEGESGVGKSALVSQFVAGVRERTSDVVVLNGRCYEREAVPYKAVDGVIDSLCEHLLGLSDEAARSIAPDDVELLVDVFPVLRRVRALVPDEPGARPGAVDPMERRSRVFAALRGLLSHLAARAPLVVIIDDLQWADADSVALLDALLAAPDSPTLLLVGTMRSDVDRIAGERSTFLRGAVRIKLGALGAEDSRELAERLMARAGGVHASAAVLAQEAAGHPLFIDELVRHAVDSAGDSVAERVPLRLEEALWSRVARLSLPAREVLETVCVAGVPISGQLVAAALAKSGDETAQLVSSLRAAHLVRTTRTGSGDSIEPYHDRIRESVLGHLEPLATMRHHERLALALEARQNDQTDALAVHWRGSGERGKAAAYAVKAAEQADAALAFGRAAHLYSLAIELGAGGDKTWKLYARRADALANCGRGADAAKAYQRATEGADEASALEFRCRAARHLLSSGHIDDGMKALRAVLSQVGFRLPSSPRSALASLLFHRARVRLRGLGFVERDESALSATALQKVDVCWSVSSALAFVDTVRAADYQTRHLLHALDAGEPYRVARAVAMEAGFVASAGSKSRERTARLLGVADVLAERSGNPHAMAVSTGCAGVAAFLQGRFRVALDLAARCERIFRERCRGVAWELDTTHIISLICLWFVGDIEEMRRRRPVFIKEARERGDLYLECSLLTGHSNLAHLVDDSPEAAREAATEAMERWTVRGFHMQHWWHMMSAAQTELYAGAGGRAHEIVENDWPALSRSLLLRVSCITIEAHYLRGAAALAAAREARSTGLLGLATRSARRAARGGAAYGEAMGRQLLGAVAARNGRAEAAVDMLGDAAARFDQADIPLFADACRYRIGELLGGDEGAVLRASVCERLSERGAAAPERLVDLLAPAVAD